MPVRTCMTALLAATLLAASGNAMADRLLIENVRGSDAQRDHRPQTGQTMNQVEARFGAPAERIAAVGQPPISRWVYDAFTVYFEHDRVLHAVTRRD